MHKTLCVGRQLTDSLWANATKHHLDFATTEQAVCWAINWWLRFGLLDSIKVETRTNEHFTISAYTKDNENFGYLVVEF